MKATPRGMTAQNLWVSLMKQLHIQVASWKNANTGYQAGHLLGLQFGGARRCIRHRSNVGRLEYGAVEGYGEPYYGLSEGSECDEDAIHCECGLQQRRDHP
jgi:hypothetical protein